MIDYLELVRAGHRSMRHEVSRILALATIYGEAAVNSACKELLSGGIIGVESLELFLKSRHHPSECELSPAPLEFQNTKLNRVVPTVDLRRYDALLFASTPPEAKHLPAGETPSASVQEGSTNHENPDNDGNGTAAEHPPDDPGSDEF